MKMNRSSDNGKAQNSGQQRLEVELHVLGDKISATGKHSHFDSNLHLHVLSAALQEVAHALRPLILNVVEMKHWEHVSGRSRRCRVFQGRWGPFEGFCLGVARSLKMKVQIRGAGAILN